MDENDPIEYERFTLGAPFSSEVMRDLVTPRPQPPLLVRVWREVQWRVPHAWRVLIHGDCDAY